MQRVVLNEVAEKYTSAPFTLPELKLQQEMLTCWNDLFLDGLLSWGYDLDNPDPPFFHVPDPDRPRG